ncbi:hypothetical protein M407DRAFT_33431 [Tulasnella calospora MUT 4182]|uniref:Uncharacterized protein n=1 Tax=Tulasnella calospora MUT 4182 TaxID=1051891 RepID=A0A0C3Q2C6_9AGAM|nr:hypothetical protein M407DRAFT_33431 [Tulasnella calospora MUT 4182]
MPKSPDTQNNANAGEATPSTMTENKEGAAGGRRGLNTVAKADGRDKSWKFPHKVIISRPFKWGSCELRVLRRRERRSSEDPSTTSKSSFTTKSSRSTTTTTTTTTTLTRLITVLFRPIRDNALARATLAPPTASLHTRVYQSP